jgi:hypothetical protein
MDMLGAIHSWLVPELLRIDASERRRLYFAAVSQWWIQALLWLSMLPFFIPVSAVIYVLPNIQQRSGYWTSVLFYPALAIAQVSYMAVILLILRSRIRRSVRQKLRVLGVPICVVCGYDLTANTSGRCPECGALAGLFQEPNGPTSCEEV